MVDEFKAAPPQFGPSARVISLAVGPHVAGLIEESTRRHSQSVVDDQSVRGGNTVIDAVDLVADLLEDDLGRLVGGRCRLLTVTSVAGTRPASSKPDMIWASLLWP